MKMFYEKDADVSLIKSKKIAISPISPFRPRRWKGKVISEKSKINHQGESD